MAIGPAFPDEALERGSLALNNRRAKDAERIAADVLRVDPRHTRASHILGCALLAQGRAEDAVGRFWLRPSAAANFLCGKKN
jgi:hypothetical protein